MFSPGGLLIPPRLPHGFFLPGVSRAPAVVAAPREEATATRTTSELSVPSRPPPLHGGTATAWVAPSGRRVGEGVMSVMCHVYHVLPSCVLIWFVSCPPLVSLLVNYVPAVFYYVGDYPVYLHCCLFS